MTGEQLAEAVAVGQLVTGLVLATLPATTAELRRVLGSEAVMVAAVSAAVALGRVSPERDSSGRWTALAPERSGS